MHLVNKIALNAQCTLNDKCIDNATCTFPAGGSAYSCQCIPSTYNLNGACGTFFKDEYPIYFR